MITKIKANTFNGFDSLQTIILYKNQISRLENGWTNGLKQLRSLDLNNNKLSTLPNGIFKGLDNLQSLSVCYNQFKFTDKANTPFTGLNKLTNLDLTGNIFLNSIGSDSFKGLTGLQTLWLRNSNIKALSINAFKLPFCSATPASGPVVIRIANNPIVKTAAGLFKNTTCYSFILSD